MTYARKKTTVEQKVHKPFLCGSPLDEHSLKFSLLFFGSLLVCALFSFIICSSTGFAGTVLRVIINLIMIAVILSIYFNNGTNQGTDAVARGEILWQKKEKGQFFSDKEQSICFHKAKGFLIGLIGTAPLFVVALLFSLNTSMQMTDSGGLPSWMDAYTGRGDIGNALVQYLQPEGMNMVDYLRVVIRVCMMPFVNLIGYENKTGMLILERLSPLVMILPAVSYGLGYLTGRDVRTNVHTAILRNEKRRNRMEKKKSRNSQHVRETRGPEQLN